VGKTNEEEEDCGILGKDNREERKKALTQGTPKGTRRGGGEKEKRNKILGRKELKVTRVRGGGLKGLPLFIG